ncbi:hypothetical protein NAT51_00420 [Flavobacterium amniphilum]|uniref:hypothetical protein n=1 Tax=Flavobacterium amniphilum TaxID=1834035 RepID=UPI00202A8265|nr:hypothetical protein [Flavobacterium amniphilum]MCL9803968.1 hypothetical protein [Flavobacterium amniphilum]
MKKKYVFLSLAFFLALNSSFGQSRIDKSKRELTEDSAVRNTTNYSNSDDDDDDNGILETFFVDVFFMALQATFFGTEYEDHLSNKLTPYPYYDDFSSGNFQEMEKRDSVTVEGRKPRGQFRVDIEENLLFNSKQLYGNYFEVKIRPTRHFYLQADLHQIQERTNFNSSNSSLSLYYFNFGYDRIRTKRFNLGWTLGASYVANNVRKGGLSFGVDTDVFLGKQISLAASTKWSAINSQPVNALEVQGRYHLNRFMVSLGYDYVKIGTPTYKFLKVGGGIYF